MRKTTPLLVQLDGQSIGDVTVSIDESKITPELTKLNSTATTISTTTNSSNAVLATVADRLTAKNSAKDDKTVAQSTVEACEHLKSIENSIQSTDKNTTIFDCASATAKSLVDNPNAPAAEQVRVGAAVKRLRDTIGQTTDADTENTAIGLLKKIKTNTEGVSTETTSQALKTLVGTADDAAGTNTVIGLLKGIAAKFE